MVRLVHSLGSNGCEGKLDMQTNDYCSGLSNNTMWVNELREIAGLEEVRKQ